MRSMGSASFSPGLTTPAFMGRRVSRLKMLASSKAASPTTIMRLSRTTYCTLSRVNMLRV